MYADDAAIFLNPVMEEVRELASLLSTFGLASGLVVNINKSACFPIRCEDLDCHVGTAVQPAQQAPGRPRRHIVRK